MKLSADQLETIRQNLRASGIKYQDVLDELLDHYATGIEARLARGQSFGDAYAEIQHGFQTVRGPWWNPFVQPGLEAFQQQYLMNAHRRVRQAHGRILKSYFHGSTLLVTLLGGALLYLVCHTLAQRLPVKGLLYLQMAFCFLPPLVFSIVDLFQRKQRLAFRQAVQAQASWSLGFANLFFAMPRLLTKSPAYFQHPLVLFGLLALTTTFWISYLQLYRKSFQPKLR